MRTKVVALALTTLAACSTGGNDPASQSDERMADCRTRLFAVVADATKSMLDVAGSYASAGPVLLKLTLTGAVRAQTIVFEGLDDEPFLSGVPEDMKQLTRPVERAFRKIETATQRHVEVLRALGKTAERCRKAAAEDGNTCVERAARRVEQSAKEALRLARRGPSGRPVPVHGLTIRMRESAERLRGAHENVADALASAEGCPA